MAEHDPADGWAPEPPPARLIRLPLRDLPVTPEIEKFVEQNMRFFRRRRPSDRAWYTDQAKLQFYFSGLHVAYLVDEPEGKVIVHVSDLKRLDRLRECVAAALTSEQRRRTTFLTPLLLNDDGGIIPPLPLPCSLKSSSPPC
jgi:hypothetical protein